MRRDVERRLAALETRTNTGRRYWLVRLHVIDPSQPQIAPRVYRNLDGAHRWETEPGEQYERFDARVTAEATAIAEAAGEVMTICGECYCDDEGKAA